MYKTYKVTKNCSIRTSPSSTSQSIVNLSIGKHLWVDTVVKKESTNGNVYYKAKYTGLTGYIRAENVEKEYKVIGTSCGDNKHIRGKVRGIVTYNVYGQTTYSDTNIKKHGCGYCVLSSALKSQGLSFTPESLEAKIFSWFGKGKALSAYGMKKTCERLGVKATILLTNNESNLMKEIDKALKFGYPVAFCNSNPHWLCLIGYDEKGKVIYTSSTKQAIRKGTLSEIMKLRIKTNKQPNTVFWKDYNSGSVVIIGK